MKKIVRRFRSVKSQTIVFKRQTSHGKFEAPIILSIPVLSLLVALSSTMFSGFQAYLNWKSKDDFAQQLLLNRGILVCSNLHTKLFDYFDSVKEVSALRTDIDFTKKDTDNSAAPDPIRDKNLSQLNASLVAANVKEFKLFRELTAAAAEARIGSSKLTSVEDLKVLARKLYISSGFQPIGQDAFKEMDNFQLDFYSKCSDEVFQSKGN